MTYVENNRVKYNVGDTFGGDEILEVYELPRSKEQLCFFAESPNPRVTSQWAVTFCGRQFVNDVYEYTARIREDLEDVCKDFPYNRRPNIENIMRHTTQNLI